MDGMDDQQVGDEDPISSAISLLKNNQDQLDTIHSMVFAKKSAEPVGALALSKAPKVLIGAAPVSAPEVTVGTSENFANYLDEGKSEKKSDSSTNNSTK